MKSLMISRTLRGIGICLLSFLASVFSVSATASLLAEWRLDNTTLSGTANEVLDSSGNGHHGQAFNGLSTVAGKVCQAGWFRGEGFNADPNNAWYTARYYIQIPHTTQLSPMASGMNAEMNLSGWIRPDTVSNMTVLMKGGGGGANEYHVFIEGGQLKFTLWNHWGGSYTGSLDYTLSAGQWYFFSFSAERQGNSANVNLSGQLYSDSSDTPLASLNSGNQSIPLADMVVNGDLHIGAIRWSTSEPTGYFNGLIDELRLHNQRLTAAELLALKNTTRDCPVTTSLIASENFDSYAPGSLLGGDSGQGWAGAWRAHSTSQEVIDTSQNPLVYNQGGQCIAGASRALRLRGTTEDAASRDLSQTVDDDVVYVSMLVRFTGTQANNKFFALWFQDPTYQNHPNIGMKMNRGNGSGPEDFFVRTTNQNETYHMDLVSGQTYFLVGRLSKSSPGSDNHYNRFELWVDPDNLDEPGSPDKISTLSNSNISAFDQLGLRTHQLSSTDELLVDSLIVGRDWETVVTPSGDCPEQPDIHHFRLLHSGSGLTCAAEAVQVIACATDNCSTRFTASAAVTLSPATSGAIRWVSGNQQSLENGEATFQLRRNTPGSVSLGIAASSPSAANATRCFSGGVEGDCSINFAESGFLFNLPDLLADKPDSFTLSARRADENNPDSCAPAFTGERSVDFRSGYTNPDSGSQAVFLNGQAISNTTGWTSLLLAFDEQANAQVDIRYPDAGLKQLQARYTGATASDEQALVLSGSDDFSSAPAGLCIEATAANAACDSADASCSVFRQAGEDFPIRVRGVVWTSDDNPQACANTTTPNYRQNNIALSSSLVAPSAGRNAELSLSQISISENGVQTEELYLSEVGVFQLLAEPQANSYFGRTVTAGLSAPIGRFIPSHFSLHYQLDAACSLGNSDAFSYSGYQSASVIQNSGQPFQINGYLLALNQQAQPTHNYQQNFAKLTASDLTGTALLAPEGISQGQFNSWFPTLQAFAQGRGDFSISTDYLAYQRPHPPLSIYPYLTATDSDDVSGSEGDAAAAGRFVSGRMLIASGHAFLETEPVNLTLDAQLYDDNRWTTHLADRCTSISAFRLDNDQAENQSSSIQIGAGTTSLLPDPYEGFIAGQHSLTLSAPGEGNSGFTNLTPLLNDQPWLRYDWSGNSMHTNNPTGRATWGLYRGNPNIIYMREVWR